MRPMIRTTFVLWIALMSTGVAVAQESWYDHYDKGLVAIRKGDWSTALDRMNKAIAGNPNEAPRARTYGTLFINYRPYYYRAVASLNLGRYQQAVSDLEKTTGPGPENMGSIEQLMQSAKSKLTAAAEPVSPAPEPQPVRPTPAPAPVPQPALPVIDAALQSRAESAVENAQSRLRAAQERNATESAPYREALAQFRDANSKLAIAKNNDELRQVIAIAGNAAMTADSASAPAVASVTPTTKSSTAAGVVLADSSRRVRAALESYFRGDFDEASQMFMKLAQDHPTNGWIWAFLGASQYSQYAFEADEQYRNQALEAFRKARTYGRWGRDGLPSKYFSRRIRRAFNETAG